MYYFVDSKPRFRLARQQFSLIWRLARQAFWVGLWLCAFVHAIGCGKAGGPTIVVNISGTPTGVKNLTFLGALDGAPLRDLDVLASTVTQVTYPLPSGASGNFVVEVRALGADGCALATGRGEVSIVGSASMDDRIAVSIHLDVRSPAVCAMTVKTAGMGEVSLNLAGFRCSKQCVFEVPAGSNIVLSPMASERFYFGGWSGACAGLAPCALQVSRPMSVGAEFFPQFCNSSNICYESPLPGDISWRGLWGATSSDFWAVGDGGQILHYDGVFWTLQPTPTNKTLYAIWGSAQNDIWAVGQDNTIVHYDGALWTVVKGPEPQSGMFQGIAGASANDVWVVGATAAGSGAIFHYDGTAFSPIDAAGLPALGSVYASRDSVIVLSQNGFVYRKNGSQFQSIGGSSPARLGLGGASDQSLFFVGASGSLEIFDGDIFHEQTGYPGLGSLYAVYALGPNDAWMVGDDGAVLHWNGTSLARFNTVTRQTLLAGFAISSDDFWAVGQHGAIVHWNGASLKAYGTPGFPSSDQYVAVSATSPSDIWVVGGNSTEGVIVHNSGQGFIPVEVPSSVMSGSSYSAVYAASPQEAFILSNNGNAPILRSLGGNFSGLLPAGLGAQPSLVAISGSGPQNVWIGGSDTTGQGVILRWNGSSFSPFAVAGIASLPKILAASVVGSNEAWFAGSPLSPGSPNAQGCILRWDGNQLSLLPNIPGNLTLVSASAAASNDVWFAGTNASNGHNVALHLQNGTITANVDLGTQPASIASISARSSTDVWAVGTSGTILHSTDGLYFEPVSSVISGSSYLFGVTTAGAAGLIVVGAQGIILRVLL